MHKKIPFIVAIAIVALGACGGKNVSRDKRSTSPLPLHVKSPLAPTMPASSPAKTPSNPTKCDRDPGHWVFQHQKYRSIIVFPKCAVSDLGRAAAWYIAIHEMGYTPFEATKALGYKEIPWAISRNSMIPYAPTPFSDAKVVPVILDFGINAREWALSDEKGTLGGITLSPNSCVFIKQRNWREKYNFPFDVECVVYVYFSPQLTVYQYHDKIGLQRAIQPLRLSIAFVYSHETKHWMYTGVLNDPMVAIAPLDMLNDTAEEDARAWGIPVWDLEWVQKTWALQPKALPAAWAHSTKGVEVMKAAQKETETWMQEHATFEVKKP